MAAIRSTDPDFRVCQVSFDALIEIQLEAEEWGFAARWSSVDALRNQVKERFVVLRPLLREKRGEVLRAYRCLVLFATVEGEVDGGVATIDVDPARFESLERLDRDLDVRKALDWMISLAAGGVLTIPKK
jgi:hypothetical protein